MGLAEHLIKDSEHAQSHIKRGPDETDEQLASRLFYRHMEVVQAYVMADVSADFKHLPRSVKQTWLDKAKNWPPKQEPVCKP